MDINWLKFNKPPLTLPLRGEEKGEGGIRSDKIGAATILRLPRPFHSLAMTGKTAFCLLLTAYCLLMLFAPARVEAAAVKVDPGGDASYSTQRKIIHHKDWGYWVF